MAQTLLSANISGVYDKLLFQKGDRKLYYSNTSGDADAEFTNVILSSNVTLNASGEKLFLSGSSNSTNYLSDTTLQTAHSSGLTVTATAGPLVFNSEEGVSFKLDSNNDGTEFFNILNNAGTTVLSIDETGKLVASGFIESKADTSLFLKTDVNMYFDIDNDNDDAQHWYWRNGADTHMMTLNELGDLVVTRNITVGGNIIKASDGGETITLDTSDNVTILGDLTVTGGDIIGTADADLNIKSDGNLSFYLDNDNDETGQKFYFYNYTTEIAALDESGNLQIDGDLTISGNTLTFGNGEVIENESDGTIAFNTPVVSIDATGKSNRAHLAVYADDGYDSNLVLFEGGSIRWSIGNDASDNSTYKLHFDYGNAVPGAASKMSLDSTGNLIIAGDITLTGNDIKDDTGTTNITVGGGGSNNDVTIAGDLTISGNNLTFGNGESFANTTDGTVAIISNAGGNGILMASAGGTSTFQIKSTNNDSLVSYMNSSSLIWANGYDYNDSNTFKWDYEATIGGATKLSLTSAGNLTAAGTITADANMAVKNGAVGPGSIAFYEDSDNGSNAVTLAGQSSTGDITVSLPSTAGTLLTKEKNVALVSIPFYFNDTTAGRTYFRDADDPDDVMSWDGFDSDDSTSVDATISINTANAVSGFVVPYACTYVGAYFMGYQSTSVAGEARFQTWTGTPGDGTASAATTVTLRTTNDISSNRVSESLATSTVSVSLSAGDMIYPAFQWVSGASSIWMGTITLKLENISG